MLRAGDRVGDRYLVIEQIAAGGMGTLWRAHHVELDVDVALKVLSMDAASPQMLQRFKREAQASARLRSPNIVHVLDYGVHEEQPYLAMELLRGEDLAARIAGKGRLSLEETARIMHAVARAMQLAHDADIIHRDLKPANVFLEKVGDEEVVKVLDFGVAKDLRASNRPSATSGEGAVGSPAYMSPEQVWGEKVDSRTDIWAMAAMTFEMLTGHCPFADETLAKIFERIIREPIPKIRDFNAELPASLDALFDKALARAPADRIASAKEFGDAFRAALEQPEAPHQAVASNGASPSPRKAPGLSTTEDAEVPFANTERPPATSPPLETHRGERRLIPLWVGLIVVVLGVGFALQLARPTSPATSREDRSPIASRAAPPSTSPAESSAHEPAPTVSDVGPPPSGSTAPVTRGTSTSRAAEAKRPSSTASSTSTRRVDPTFGIPLPQ
jgi:eukaryotic-like serine/threonine-protein kinase